MDVTGNRGGLDLDRDYVPQLTITNAFKQRQIHLNCSCSERVNDIKTPETSRHNDDSEYHNIIRIPWMLRDEVSRQKEWFKSLQWMDVCDARWMTSLPVSRSSATIVSMRQNLRIRRC